MSDSAVPLCEHIKDNGERCRAIALRNRHFCYFHSRIHRPKALPGKSGYRISALESRHAIQVATTHVVQSLLDGSIDAKVASAALRGFSLANRTIRQQYSDPLVNRSEVPESMEDFLAAESAIPSTADASSQPDNPTPLAEATGNPQAVESSPAAADGQLERVDSALPLPNKPVLPADVALLRRVVRLGPTHPAFKESVRLLDAYISGKSAG